MNGLENGDGWRRLHPVTPLLRSVQLLYALIFGALAAQFGGPVLLVLLASLAALAAWLARHPRVLQRPIVIDEVSGAAVVGRPPEKVNDLLGS